MDDPKVFFFSFFGVVGAVFCATWMCTTFHLKSNGNEKYKIFIVY